MSPKSQPLRFAGIAVLVLLLVSLWMMNQATSNPEHFGRYYYPLLITNSGALIALLGLIVVKLFELWRAWRQQLQGVMMTLRMVTYATLLVLAPVLTVYYFSQDFLRRGIDSWFNLQVEKSLEDALTLSREALNVHMRTRLKETEAIAPNMVPQDGLPLSLLMDENREKLGAIELTLFNRSNGEIVASSSANLTELVPRLIDEEALGRLTQGGNVVGLTPATEENLSIYVSVNVASTAIESEPYVAQALFRVPQRISELTNSVQSGFGQYQNISYLREQLKITFILILTLALLFAVFSGIWGVFALTDKMLAPINELVRGTQRVAVGDYDIQLPITSSDELGFLVQSFNTMTGRVAASSRDLERQRTYLNSILEQISSGVMVCDHNFRLRTWNENLQRHLRIKLTEQHINTTLDKIDASQDQKRTLLELDQHLRNSTGSWQEQLYTFGESGNRILRCSGTAIKSLPEEHWPGHIVVVDDVTELVNSQKSAAWGEVAQRLAHEIRNPLTPIQLAAERLRHKCLPQIRNMEDIAMLTRLTTTIENQVQAMRNMLDAFKQFASPPLPDCSYVDLAQLVRETTDLYRHTSPNTKIELDMDEIPSIWADRGKMLQVLNNLFSNSLQSNRRDDTGGTLSVSIKEAERNNIQHVQLTVRDNGSGIPQKLMKTMFEPYVTGHKTGTGLGLAIVKKIVDEHHGTIHITNNEPPPGACATVLLPIKQMPKTAPEQHNPAA